METNKPIFELMGFVHKLYRWKYVGFACLHNATIHHHFLQHEMSFLQMEHYVKLTLHIIPTHKNL